MENWLTLKDFANYQVSTLGRIKNVKTGRILNQYKTHNGYKNVKLYIKSVQYTRYVHQLVAIAFLNHNNNSRKIVIDHINEDKEDNRLENLRILTQRENASRTPKGKTSKHIGVWWYKPRSKWISKIRINGKQKYLGLFNTEEEARDRYLEELKKITS